MARIRTGGTPIPVVDRLLPLEEFLDFIRLSNIQELDERLEDKEVRTSL